MDNAQYTQVAKHSKQHIRRVQKITDVVLIRRRVNLKVRLYQLHANAAWHNVGVEVLRPKPMTQRSSTTFNIPTPRRLHKVSGIAGALACPSKAQLADVLASATKSPHLQLTK